jgi:hypothetical protein
MKTSGTVLILGSIIVHQLPTYANSDYLQLDATSQSHKTQISLSWNGGIGGSFKVKWKKSSDDPFAWEKDKDVTSSDVTTGSGGRWYYTVGGLQCNTEYDFKVKLKGRGWRDATAKTQGCGSLPCPKGGSFDSKNCFFGKAPAGTSAFIHNNNYYYSPVLSGISCPLPNTHFDGANCFVRAVPTSVKPFIYDNGWYYVGYP